MGNFRYKFEDRYAETQGYDFFDLRQRRIRSIF